MDLIGPNIGKKLNTILSELRHRLKELYGPRLNHLILYGSQARGDAKPGSDIDILVVLNESVNQGDEIERTEDIVAELSLRYDEVISCVFVSTERFEHEKSSLLSNVRREGVTWFSLETQRRPSPMNRIKESQEGYAASKADNDHATPEQVALLQKARDSLKAARLLADQGYYDFAASRAYFTMFYVASAFLVGEGLTFSKHSTVIALFGQHFAKTGHVPAEFHRYLIRAENTRKAGDYDIGTSLTQAQAVTQITRAEQFCGRDPNRDDDCSIAIVAILLLRIFCDQFLGLVLSQDRVKKPNWSDLALRLVAE